MLWVIGSVLQSREEQEQQLCDPVSVVSLFKSNNEPFLQHEKEKHGKAMREKIG